MMTPSRRAILTTLLISLVPLPLTAPRAAEDRPFELTPQRVVDRIVSESREARRLRLQKERAGVPVMGVKGRFDWFFNSSTGYEISQAESLSGLNNEEDRTFTLATSVSRKLRTGTTFDLSFSRVDQTSVLNPFLQNLRDSDRVFDTLSLTVRQELSSNFFGVTDRYALAIAESRRDQAGLVYAEELENLALRGLSLYWRAYTARESLREQTAARERYAELVETLERRSKLGFAETADVLKARAELRSRVMTVKTASLSYLNALDELFRIMRMDTPEEVNFRVPSELPQVPAELGVDIDSSRLLRARESEVENARLELRAARLASLPDVDLVGAAGFTGSETTGGAAFSELTSGRNPEYSIGLELNVPLDSDTLKAARTDKRIAFDEAVTSRDRLRETKQRSAREKARRVRGLYQIAQAAIETVRLREKVVKEREKAFEQGRVDLQQLILDYNDFFRAQSTRAIAVGDYHLALNELAAEQDRLMENLP